jgi:hypothetical protein
VSVETKAVVKYNADNTSKVNGDVFCTCLISYSKEERKGKAIYVETLRVSGG